jgi:rare lipoprotein A
VTKRRPWWSDRLRRAAALACGLLLLNVSSTAWATSKKPSAKKHVVARTHHKKNDRSKSGHKDESLAPELGVAEISDADTLGLRGKASFYGQGFHGRKTATGEIFDHQEFTAASNRFPLGTMVAVRRLDNGRCAIVKVNDRMHPRHRVRIIDVSRGVAEYLDMVRAGVVLVRAAPLKAGVKGKGQSACHAAFDPPENDCPSCGQLPRLPDFSGDPPIDEKK